MNPFPFWSRFQEGRQICRYNAPSYICVRCFFVWTCGVVFWQEDLAVAFCLHICFFKQVYIIHTISFFQVTFWSPKWRSFNPEMGHLKKHPRRSTWQNLRHLSSEDVTLVICRFLLVGVVMSHYKDHQSEFLNMFKVIVFLLSTMGSNHHFSPPCDQYLLDPCFPTTKCCCNFRTKHLWRHLTGRPFTLGV